MNAKAEKLAAFISSLKDFEMLDTVEGRYNHVGALLTDAALQAGVNYRHVVKPRVNKLLEQYPEHRTTSEFLQLLDTVGTEVLINWKADTKKARTLYQLTRCLIEHKKETEGQIREWITELEAYKVLRGISGIGDKTFEYLQMLVGVETNAVDRYFIKLLKEARIEFSGYFDASEIVKQTAKLLDVTPDILDYSLWVYMSEKKSKD